MSKEEIRQWLKKECGDYMPGDFVPTEVVNHIHDYAAPLEARIRELEEGLRELRRCSPVLRGDTFVCITPVKEYVNAYKAAQQLLLSGAAVGDKMFNGSKPLSGKEAEILNVALRKSQSDKPTNL